MTLHPDHPPKRGHEGKDDVARVAAQNIEQVHAEDDLAAEVLGGLVVILGLLLLSWALASW